MVFYEKSNANFGTRSFPFQLVLAVVFGAELILASSLTSELKLDIKVPSPFVPVAVEVVEVSLVGLSTKGWKKAFEIKFETTENRRSEGCQKVGDKKLAHDSILFHSWIPSGL